ncbi:MAG: hybrid sensor histidine kinase/response regulator [Cyanobacteria bacterium P01_H01_bin.15]
MKSDRILVVDDASDNLKFIEGILQNAGYEVVKALDRLEALSHLSKQPCQLILLDHNKPDVGGLDVVQEIRAQPSLPFIPILLFTSDSQITVAEALDAGADDFIRKPVDVDELLARVRSLLRLKHSADERERMARQREELVSLLAHDLRTPLIAADQMLSLLAQESLGPLTPDQGEALLTLLDSQRSLLAMTNNLLEVYRYEVDRKTLYFAPVDLQRLSEQVVAELTPLAHSKNLTLTRLPVTDLRLTVFGDRLELRRVLTNLVGNALKFTQAGSIIVTLQRQPNRKIRLEVADTGPGISPQDMAYLFERFHQGRHQRPGSGLGLYLSRQIINSHQGNIGVESQLGQGSLFWIELPPVEAVSPQSAEISPSQGS